MNRPILIYTKQKNGVYDDPLTHQIRDRFHPIEPKRDAWFWLKAFGYGAGAVALKAGAIAGFVVLSPVIVGIWAVRKAWRAGK